MPASRAEIVPGMHIDIDTDTPTPHAALDTAAPAIRMAAAMLASRITPHIQITGLEALRIEPNLSATIARDAEATLTRTIRILAEEHCRNAIARTVIARACKTARATRGTDTHRLRLTVPVAPGIELDESIDPEQLAAITADPPDPAASADQLCESLDDAIADAAAKLAELVRITHTIEAPGLPGHDLERLQEHITPHIDRTCDDGALEARENIVNEQCLRFVRDKTATAARTALQALRHTA